jgi:(heptosyl)LPS beta-1,4-glucosyltransferase
VKISAYMIVQNEAHDIGDAISSLDFVDEIVVVDGGSVDGTSSLAEANGARVAHRPFDNFGAQIAFARSLCRGKWLLEIAADERVSRPLQEEILSFVEADDHDGLLVPFLHHAMGRELSHGGWRGQRYLRLVRRSAMEHDAAGASLVHERLVLPAGSRVKQATAPFLHFPYLTRDEYRRKWHQYTLLEAKELLEAWGTRPIPILPPSLRSSSLMAVVREVHNGVSPREALRAYKNQAPWLLAPLTLAVGRFIRSFVLQNALGDGMVGGYLAMMGSLYPIEKYRQFYRLRATHGEPSTRHRSP